MLLLAGLPAGTQHAGGGTDFKLVSSRAVTNAPPHSPPKGSRPQKFCGERRTGGQLSSLELHPASGSTTRVMPADGSTSPGHRPQLDHGVARGFWEPLLSADAGCGQQLPGLLGLWCAPLLAQADRPEEPEPGLILAARRRGPKTT